MKSLTYIAQAYRVGPSGERPGICQVRSCGRYCAEKGFQDRVAVKNFLEIPAKSAAISPESVTMFIRMHPSGIITGWDWTDPISMN